MPLRVPHAATVAAPSQAVGLVTVDGRNFPLKQVTLTGRAEGGLAVTRLVQTYTNPFDEPLETLYTLPLPADGAVIAYTIHLGERVIRGEIERREDARKAYQHALEEGRTAGLLEQERADTFTQSLGNLAPGETARVEIEVLHPLAFIPADGAPAAEPEAGAGEGDTDAAGEDEGDAGEADNGESDANEAGAGDGDASDTLRSTPVSRARQPEWEYRFPTVVGVRYEGAPGRVADADQLDVDRGTAGTPVRLDLELTLADGATDILKPHSSTHALAITDTTAPRAADTAVTGATTPSSAAPHPSATSTDDRAPVCHLTLTDTARLDRDVVVRWHAATPDVGLRLVEGGGLPGDNGRYGLLTLTPPAAPQATFARDLTVLLDASGSMGGEPLKLAKSVVDHLLDGLRPDDRVEILAFGSTVMSLTGQRARATHRFLRRARKNLIALHAGGATEMAAAIRQALEPLRDNAQHQVVLITDGYIGFEEEVVGLVRRGVVPGVRLHVVGIGAAPNRTLMAGAARAGGGIEVAAHDAETARQAATRLGQATAAPVLTDVTIEGGACLRAVQAGQPDVLAGRPLVVAIELPAQNSDVVVRGRLAGRNEEWVQTVHASGMLTTPLPLGALFGREAVADAEMRLSGAGAPDERQTILDEVEALGLRHRITTRRTSLVAVAEEPTVDPREPRRKHRLPVEMPAGVSAEGVGYASPTDTRFLWGSSTLAMAEGVARYGEVSPASHRQSICGIDDTTTPASPSEFLDALDLEGQGVTDVTVVRCEGDLLVVEFECPGDEFVLPAAGDVIHVVTPNRDHFTAEVDAQLSTSPGAHEAGLTLRLALRRTGDDSSEGDERPQGNVRSETWPEGTFVIVWTRPPANATEPDATTEPDAGWLVCTR